MSSDPHSTAKCLAVRTPSFASKGLLLLLLTVLCATQLGAVRRRLTVRSTPPGALVYIDDQYIGVTPVSTAFIYYGTRKIQLIKGGFETVTVKQNIRPPWYQYVVVDFFTENFTPGEFRDERELAFTLEPQQIVPAEVLRERAEQLRGQSRQGVVAPLLTPGLPTTMAPPVINSGNGAGPGYLPPPGAIPPSGSLPPGNPTPGGFAPQNLPPPNNGYPPQGAVLPPNQSGSLGAPTFVTPGLPGQALPPNYSPPNFPQPNRAPANSSVPGFRSAPSGRPLPTPPTQPIPGNLGAPIYPNNPPPNAAYPAYPSGPNNPSATLPRRFPPSEQSR